MKEKRKTGWKLRIKPLTKSSKRWENYDSTASDTSDSNYRTMKQRRGETD